MRNYRVNSGFMAFQFNGGKPTWCIGIECNALAQAGEYHCIVGKGKTTCDVTLDTVNKLIDKYGLNNILRKQHGKNIYVIPVHEVKNKPVEEIPEGQASLFEKK